MLADERRVDAVIPPLTASGALPPYTGSEPHIRTLCSPYRASLSELSGAFANTPDRRVLLTGFLDYRNALRTVGIIDGFQLVDGSFTEDCEARRGLPPSDIDVVTFALLPVPRPETLAFMGANAALFSPAATKAAYKCDAYFIDLGKPSRLIAEDTMYLFGLFSHQRVTALWKGMVRVPLISDDDAVRAALVAHALAPPPAHAGPPP